MRLQKKIWIIFATALPIAAYPLQGEGIVLLTYLK
jgi:hypothetical protein